MTKYIPYPFFYDDVPIDISFLFEKDKPAGNHGFLKVSGRDFVFEDGTKVKFWGTNFNGAGCFPEHDYAKKLARRLAKIGINLVRMHQLDSEWHTPNIFAFTKGKRVTEAHLDPESIDRLDFLIKCLKDEGIYVYMDMFTYRKFRSDEGVENAHKLADAGKPYCCYSRKLIELQKKFSTELWTHKNPYTGSKYCDEPAIVLAEIVNECELFYKPESFIYDEPYKSEFIEMFDNWLKKQGINRDLSNINLSSWSDDQLLDFKIELQKNYFREMYDHMRADGVKIPITGTNWACSEDVYKAHEEMDYLDTHPYFYDWRWGEFEKFCINKSVTEIKKSYLTHCSVMADKDRPMYVSEWDAPWPNEYRADSVIYSAAIGMLQGWSGFAIHTYSYSTSLDNMKMLGKEFACEKIGNTPYRQGIFSTWNDPAKFGLFYHAAILTRRGDVKAADEFRAIEYNTRTKSGEKVYEMAIDKYALVNPKDGIEVYNIKEEEGANSVTSSTGELYRDTENNYGYVNTPMTKCAYGFLGKNGKIELDGVNVKTETDFAVIAMSSLLDKPIIASDNILLTTVGRAKNTNAKFDGEKMLEYGESPVLIESIETEIEIETAYSDMVVWAISAEGYYIGNPPSEYKDGKLKISLGKESMSMYYLIVRS